MSVTIIAIDVDDLPDILKQNGYTVVTGDDALSTAGAMKAAGEKYIIIADASDPITRSWLSLQAGQRVPTLLVVGDPIVGTRSIELPASLNDIMELFGAPATEAGEVIIGGNVDPEPEVDEEEIFSIFGGGEIIDVVEESEFTSGATDEQAVEPEPTEVEAPSVFGAPPAGATSVFGSPPAKEVDVPNAPSVFGAPPAGVTSVFEKPADAPPAPSVFATPVEEPKPLVIPELVVPPRRESPPSVFEVPAPAPTKPEPAPVSTPVPPATAQPVATREAEPVVRFKAPQARSQTKKSQVIVVFGAKGGIGKSTTVISLAERAATTVVRPSEKKFRVIAIDANRGQGDMRTYLHLRDLPSIYDAAKSGRPASSILTPTKLGGYRLNKPELHFGVVLAPTQEQADPTIVTSSVYAEVIEEARSLADLVIIDTQIKEFHDTTGIFDEVIVPLLRSGAWGLGITNSTTASYDNLKRALTKLQSDGISRDRIMFTINNADPQGGIDPGQVEDLLSHLAHWAGLAEAEPSVAAAGYVGAIPGSNFGDDFYSPKFTSVLDNVIGRVLGGSEVLLPSVDRSAQEVGQKEKRRFWGRG